VAAALDFASYAGFYAVIYEGRPGSSLYQGVVNVIEAKSAKQAVTLTRRRGDKRRGLYAYPVVTCPTHLHDQVIRFIANHRILPTQPVPRDNHWAKYAGTHASFSAPDD
jgi:hypothetical protein